ncbi:Eco57I restriction-modification methylase domain-containing protein [Mycoplasmopsis gallinarum]
MENKKIKLGQFFTVKKLWLKPQIIDFIKKQNKEIAYDPFAGNGDLLNLAKEDLDFKKIQGLDIDPTLSWEINDSLKNIPIVANSLIITNPPYLSKQSAKRKKINMDDYFKLSTYDDIYLIALEKMLQTNLPVVAIIPESFINSNFKLKNYLSSITIIEDEIFSDTENPVIVACFDNKDKANNEILVYKNDVFIDNFANILKIRLKPKNNIEIKFNDLNGWLGLKAVDGIKKNKDIKFDFPSNINYDWKNKITISSRHYSLIAIEIKEDLKLKLINQANKILKDLREKSSDVILTPFKGNNKFGNRRRRLDFNLCRAILEEAYMQIKEEK